MEHTQKHRMTQQRQIILDAVIRHQSHPTADEIYDEVRKTLPRISMGTVYRNLDMLASAGLIRKLDPGLPQMRFDKNPEEHYHLTCIRCGKIEDAEIKILKDSLDNLNNVIGNLTKYGIFGHKLEFIGLCSECKKEGKDVF